MIFQTNGREGNGDRMTPWDEIIQVALLVVVAMAIKVKIWPRPPKPNAPLP
jgi:outer membrane phospholipase A